MDVFKKIFPYSFGTTDVTSLVVKVVIQVIVALVIDLILGLLASIPYVGFLFAIAAWLIGVYFSGGIVITFLAHFKVIK